MTALQSFAPEAIALRIATARGQRIIVDADLATLYGVETKRFNEAVKRNLGKFPSDLMLKLTPDEWAALRSQLATLNAAGSARGQHRKYLPYAFTEHGAIMAATILSSPRAIEVSVYVVRAFVRMRELAVTHADLAKRPVGLSRPRTRALGARGQDARLDVEALRDFMFTLSTDEFQA